MALKHRSLSNRSLAFRLGRITAYIPDLLVWGALVGVLERVRPYATHDGADLMALGILTLLGFGITRVAGAGHLPATRGLLKIGSQAARRLAKPFAPRYAVAFRPSPGVVPLSEPKLLGLVYGLGILAAGFTFAGGLLFTGLWFLRASVSYTLYLALLAGIWTILLAVLVLGVFAATEWVRRTAALPRVSWWPAPRLFLAVGWIGGTAVLAVLPSFVAILLVFGLGMWAHGQLRNRPPAPYLFCRRDTRGRPLAIGVDRLIHRVFLVLVLALTAATALGQGGRWFEPGWPTGPFALTHAIAELAALASLLVIVRATIHVRRMTGGPVPPEVPLTPTVWAKADADANPAWRAAAEAQGFRVHAERTPPPRGFDLVVAPEPNPQRFEPRAEATAEDLGWQIRRRFHVVMRRRFMKRFERLVKLLRAGKRKHPGSGYLFCPHAWMMHGVVRDVQPDPSGSRALAGPRVVGPTYREVFSPRVRRYVGSILRRQGIDITYFEDAIRWPDLKRVFRVIFEIDDQDRGPIQGRHFVGLPGVKVLVQSEPSEPEPMPERPYATPAAGHVRVLVITRDRGGEEELASPAAPGSRRKLPQLV